MDLQIYVATHKKVNLNLPDYCDLVQAGSAMHDKIKGYLHDDEFDVGEGISWKNESYCELTVLYYLWKKCDANIKGLFHYRRFFYNGTPLKGNEYKIQKHALEVKKCCITKKQIEESLEENDVIVEIPYNPFPRNGREDLERFCYREDIEKLRGIIEKFYPEYTQSYYSVMEASHLSYCNMMIAKREVFDEYCEWLFDVLGKCEDVIDISHYDVAHKRIYGYFAEVLMNVYLKKHQLKEKWCPVFCVSEYSVNNNLRTLRLMKTGISQWLGEKNIVLPTKRTKKIREFNQWAEENT